MHMKRWGRRIGYGVGIWAILYALSIPLLGVQQSDPIAFKAIMAFLGSAIGAVGAGAYFLAIDSNYVREAVFTALTWIISNWILDVVALLPFTQETIPQYFMHIGIEYLGIFAVLFAIGYVLERKSRVSIQ